MCRCDLCGYDFGNPSDEWMRHACSFDCIKHLKAEIERLRADGADNHNWRGAVTHALQPNAPEDISRGRALDIIAELRKRGHERFRVVRDELSGWCYSFYDHFELHWDDGTHELWRAELSTDGTRKAGGGDDEIQN